MGDFIFSMDSHVVEPKGLWQDNLPTKFKDRALRAERRDGYIVFVADSTDLGRMQIGDGVSGNEKIGGNNPELRIKDMAKDGINGEVIYPNLGMMSFIMQDGELSLACMQVYNDWLMKTFGGYPDVFVPTAMLPMREVSETLDEFKRVVDMGYRSVMLPVQAVGTIKYNNPILDPVWEYASSKQIPLSFHVSTGLQTVQERGPGAAVINYVKVGLASEDLIAYLVCGGTLDRFPDLQVITVEAGASWLGALCERMDESYQAHHYYVKPKLSMLPSEFVRRQVKATFQFDRACLISRNVTGHEALVWASDYPHMEGTFPYSQQAIEKLFAGLDVPPNIRADILGGTAAKLFKLEAA